MTEKSVTQSPDLKSIKEFFEGLEQCDPPICKELFDLADQLIKNTMNRVSQKAKTITGISRADEKSLAISLMGSAKSLSRTYSSSRRKKLFDNNLKRIYKSRMELLVTLDNREDRELVKKFVELWESEKLKEESAPVETPNYKAHRDDDKIIAIWKAMGKKNAYNPDQGYNKKTIEDWLGGPKAELDYGDGTKGKVASATAALVQAGKASLIAFKEVNKVMHDKAKKVCLFKPDGKLYFESSPDRINQLAKEQAGSINKNKNVDSGIGHEEF